MADFPIGQGNLLPLFDVRLRGPGPGDPNLTIPGLIYTFRMTPTPGCSGKVVTGPFTVIDPLAKLVRYSWVAGDTDYPGIYRAVFTITFPGSPPRPLDYPNDDYYLVRIRPKV